MINISDILTIQATVPMPNSAPSSRLDLPDHPGVTSWQRPRQSDAKEALLMKHTTGEECNKGQLSWRISWGADILWLSEFLQGCKSSTISWYFVQSWWFWNQCIIASKPFSDHDQDFMVSLISHFVSMEPAPSHTAVRQGHLVLKTLSSNGGWVGSGILYKIVRSENEHVRLCEAEKNMRLRC